MDDALKAQLRQELDRFEGYRQLPYDDATGKPLTVLPSGGKVTIGRGRNLSGKPLSPLIIEMLFNEDLGEAERGARRLFPKFDDMSQNRQAAVVNLVFNMGESKLREFKRTVTAVNAGNWTEAARHLCDSRWAKQVQKERVDHIVTQLHLG